MHPLPLPAGRLGQEGWEDSPGAKDNFVKPNLIKEQMAFKANLKSMNAPSAPIPYYAF